MSGQQEMSFDDAVETALKDLRDGDITNYTMEGLMRQFRFASGVLLGYRLAGAVSKKQWLKAMDRLTEAHQSLLDNHLCWRYLPRDSAWSLIDEQ